MVLRSKLPNAYLLLITIFVFDFCAGKSILTWTTQNLETHWLLVVVSQRKNSYISRFHWISKIVGHLSRWVKVTIKSLKKSKNMYSLITNRTYQILLQTTCCTGVLHFSTNITMRHTWSLSRDLNQYLYILYDTTSQTSMEDKVHY